MINDTGQHGWKRPARRSRWRSPAWPRCPAAGDIFNAVEDERLARELVEQRKPGAKEEQFNAVSEGHAGQPL